jgi:hypothetical protein
MVPSSSGSGKLFWKQVQIEKQIARRPKLAIAAITVYLLAQRTIFFFGKY